MNRFKDILYKQVKDPNLVGSLSGHKEGIKAFEHYLEINEQPKKSWWICSIHK